MNSEQWDILISQYSNTNMKFLIAITSLLANQAFAFFAFDNQNQNNGPIIHHQIPDQQPEPSYQQAYGAMSKTQHESADSIGPGLRSTSQSTYKTVNEILTLAARSIPEADEFAALRNCFTKRAHKFPEKMEYWNDFKMYLASDWFKLWGYQCGGDFKCWKIVLQQFPQFDKDQARDSARCVMKLVRDRKNQMK